jgi:hypothetical protein
LGSEKVEIKTYYNLCFAVEEISDKTLAEQKVKGISGMKRINVRKPYNESLINYDIKSTINVVSPLMEGHTRCIIGLNKDAFRLNEEVKLNFQIFNNFCEKDIKEIRIHMRRYLAMMERNLENVRHFSDKTIFTRVIKSDE